MPTPLQIEQRQWKRSNRGVLKRIAEECNVSRVWVSRVFNGHRSSYDNAIEDKLRDLNAPGFLQKRPQGKA